MRRNLYEILNEMEFDIQSEYENLCTLFMGERCLEYNNRYVTIADYINLAYFRSLEVRGTCLSLKEMFEKLGLNYIPTEIDSLLLLCEFIFAVIPDEQYKRNQALAKCTNVLFQNIMKILEKTNHELSQNAEGNYIIIEKNKAASLAAQLVEKEVSLEILEYNHFALKGDLEGKRKILGAIASYVEPILNSHALRDNGFSQLESDTSFVFNNFHIRHNNKDGTKANDYIATIIPDDLEEWYDKAYQLAISAIIMVNYLPIKQEIKDIKQKYTFKN